MLDLVNNEEYSHIGAILLAIQITLEAILKILKECLLRSRPHRPHAHKAIGE